jgi:hypothetical protein
MPKKHSPLRFLESSLTPEQRAKINDQVAAKLAEVAALIQGASKEELEDAFIFAPRLPKAKGIRPTNPRRMHRVTVTIRRKDAEGLVNSFKTQTVFSNGTAGEAEARAYYAAQRKLHPDRDVKLFVAKLNKDTRKNRNRVDRRNKVNGAKIGRRKAAKQ